MNMHLTTRNDSSLHPIALTFLLVTTGLIVLPHAVNIPVPLFIFFIILLIWRITVIWGQISLPNKWFLLALSALGIMLMAYQFQGILGRDAGTNLLVVSLGLKLLETRKIRDFYLVVFISYLNINVPYPVGIRRFTTQ